MIDGTSYCTGYCTWYAYSRRPAGLMKYLGHAKDVVRERAKKGVPVGETPVVGAIAWWDGRVGYGYGHVAYVERVDANSVVVAEMNARGWNVITRRTIAS